MVHYNLIIDNLPLSKGADVGEVDAYVARLGGGRCQIRLKSRQDGTLYAECEAPNESVYQRLLAASGTNWEGAVLEIHRPQFDRPVERMVYVGNIPEDTTPDEILAALSQFGDIERVVPKLEVDNPYAFVTFRQPAARDAALRGRRGARIRNSEIRVGAVKPDPNAGAKEIPLRDLTRLIDDLASRVESDTDFRGMSDDVTSAHRARQKLFEKGQIGLSESVALEERVQASWNVVDPRLRRHVEQVKADITTVEEEFKNLVDGWSGSEQFHRSTEEVAAILDAMSVLPPGRYGPLSGRIKPLVVQMRDYWFGDIDRRLTELEQEFRQLPDPSSLSGGDALRDHYRRIGLLRESLRELLVDYDDPPLRFQADGRFRRFDRRQAAMRAGLHKATVQASVLLKSEVAAVVHSSMQRLFEISTQPDASLRDCLDLARDVQDTVEENHAWVEAGLWDRFRTARRDLEERNHRARTGFLSAVDQLAAEVAEASPNRAEELLDQVKALHQAKRALVLPRDMLVEVSDKLNGTWEQLSRQVAAAHRTLGESLTNDLCGIEAQIDAGHLPDLHNRLKALFERVRNSRLSYRRRNALEDRIDGLFARLRERKNKTRDTAMQWVKDLEDSLEQGETADATGLRTAIKNVRVQINNLGDLSPGDRHFLHERLEAVWKACDEHLDQEASRLEPEVAECERLAAEGRFDVVFSRIHQLQQAVNEIGVSRQTWAIRERLNKAWSLAQEKQSAVAGELASLLEDRLAACEQLAQNENDFAQVFETLKDAEDAYRSKPSGLRIAGNYRQRLDEAWDKSRRRARDSGDRTRQSVGAVAEKVRGMLACQAPMGQVFRALHELNDFKRSRWKNREDMNALDEQVGALWREAKRRASEQTESAVLAARDAIDRCRYFASYWFDWDTVRSVLDESVELIRGLPVFHSEKEKLLAHIAELRTLAATRRREDYDERFSFDWLIFRRWYCIQRGMVALRNPRWAADAKGMDTATLSERDLFILTQLYDIIPRYSTDREGNAFEGVEFDETKLDFAVLRKFRLPPNWYQPWTRIRIDFPAAYPTAPPLGWYMDPNLNIRGWRSANHHFPNKAFHGAQAHAGWAWYCCWIESQQQPGSWCPPAACNPRARDNLWSFLEVVRSALASEDA